MKQVEIYINECVKRLPASQKKDIQEELSVEISAMIQEKVEAGILQEEAVQLVLEELGDPKQLANQYNNKKNYLIGPTYYNMYIRILKIVMVSVLIGVSIALGVGFVLQDVHLGAGFTNQIVIDFIIDSISVLVSVALQIFVWVTVVFALIEKNEQSLFEKQEIKEKWSIKELPKSINKKDPSNTESMISIVLYSIILIVLNIRLDVFSIVFIQDNKIQQLIPIFNISTASEWLFSLSLVFVLLITTHLIRLASSTLSKKKELFIVSLRIVALALILWIVATQDVLTPGLAYEIAPNNQAFFSMVHRVYVVTISVIVSINILSISKKVYQLIKLDNK